MKHITKRFLAITCVALGAALATPAWSQQSGHAVQMKGGAKTMSDTADGEVRRVDKAAGKVTLRHGELKQLDMPPMTMVFEAKDKSILDGIKVGDKVKFKAMDDNGKLIVTEIKPAS